MPLETLPTTYLSLYLSPAVVATCRSMSLNSSISGVSSPILFSSSTASATSFLVDSTCEKRPRVTLANSGKRSRRTQRDREEFRTVVGSVGSAEEGGGEAVVVVVESSSSSAGDGGGGRCCDSVSSRAGEGGGWSPESLASREGSGSSGSVDGSIQI